MERLTEKNINGRCYEYDIKTSNIESSTVIEGIAIKNCIHKLGQYEDIEEELGIDLITLFKALKNGFYTKKAHYSGYGMGVSITQKCLWDEKWQDDIYYFKDYGKTWALTKEELENDK